MSSIKTELYPEAATRHSKTSEAYRKAKFLFFFNYSCNNLVY